MKNLTNKEIAEKIIEAFRNGNKLFAIGNGGSAAQAQHFTAELVGKFAAERRALPAISLTTDTSALTAIANDYGYENVFVRQLEALGERGDVLLTLSTSGRSENVLKAISWAKNKGLVIIRLPRTGRNTAEIQENHLFMLHNIARIVEKAFT